MPFGLSITLATFQCLIHHIFNNIELHKTILIVLNDITIYSPKLEEYANHAKNVMMTLRAANLKLEAESCQSQVENLCYIINKKGGIGYLQSHGWKRFSASATSTEILSRTLRRRVSF